MSLNTWSLIIFASHMLFYLSMVIAIGSNTSMFKMSIMVVSWILYQTVTLWYGISTNQIGFILIFIFQFIATFMTILISTERSINENI